MKRNKEKYNNKQKPRKNPPQPQNIKFYDLTLPKLFQQLKDSENKELIENIEKSDFSEKSKSDFSEKYIINHHYEGVRTLSEVTNNYVFVEHNNKIYAVMTIRWKKKDYYTIFDAEDLEKVKNYKYDNREGHWLMKNKMVAYSRGKKKPKYLHNLILGKLMEDNKVDFKNEIRWDLRKKNLKEYSKENIKSKAKECSLKQIENIPEPYRSYYLNNKTPFVNWFPTRKKGHLIIAGPLLSIPKKKFNNREDKVIPKLMKQAEDYLLEEANKQNISKNELVKYLRGEDYELRREYEIIVEKAKKILSTCHTPS